MKMNNNYQMVVEESDLVQYLYNGIPLTKITVSSHDWIDRFNKFSELFDMPDRIEYELASELSTADFISACVGVDGWNLPEYYHQLDIEQYLLEMCKTGSQQERVATELVEFQKRNMYPVLKFLLYFVNTLRENKIVWGVGRGSSVASYVLFLLGVHKIDALKYNLDIKEFLK